MPARPEWTLVLVSAGLNEIKSRMDFEADVDGFTGRYIPAVGRFLIVCTFIEDALRIVTQWGDQLTYLRDYRKSM